MSLRYQPPTAAELELAAQIHAEIVQAIGDTALRPVSVSLNPEAVSEFRRELPLTVWGVPVHFDDLVPPGQVFVNLEVPA